VTFRAADIAGNRAVRVFVQSGGTAGRDLNRERVERMWSWSNTRRRVARAAGGIALAALLTACTSAPEVTATPAPSGSGSAPSTPSPASSATATPTPSQTPSPSATEADPSALTIDITIAGGKVDPNGDKIKVAVGQKVILNVESDEDDEIHAHTDDEGYELAVKAGKPARGSFTLESPGSYEIESHHLQKTIAVLNAR
jgi:hypothetical protein